MPTGLPANRNLFQAWVDFAHAHQVMLVHDNPYSLVLHPEPISILEMPGAFEVALELNSLSKSHQMAGWRIGMLAGRADAVANVLRYKSQMDSGIFLPLQQAAAVALQLDDTYHQELQLTYRKRRNVGLRLFQLLGASVQEPQAGMFLWARIPPHYANSDALSDALLHGAGVFLTPGHVFGSRGNDFIRLSLCSPEGVLEEALQRIQQWMSSLTLNEFIDD
jgi:aspartate/methionine/tyrosine aminotransferase